MSLRPPLWNFFKNSSVLAAPPVPYWSMIIVQKNLKQWEKHKGWHPNSTRKNTHGSVVAPTSNFRPLCWVWPSICAFNKSQGRFKACNFTLFCRSVFLHMRVYWYSLYSTIGEDCHQALRDYHLLILNYHDFISSRRKIKLKLIKNWENKSFEQFDQTQQTTLLKTAKYNIKSSLPSSIDRQMLHKPLNMFEEV